jgi:hypothetical protein
MHACNSLTLDQLVSLRDGEPIDARIAQHAERCAHCSQELTRLRTLQAALKSLPTLSPPAYNSAGLHARLRASRTYRAASVAAVLSVGALTLLLIAAVTDMRPRREQTVATDATLQQPVAVSDGQSEQTVNSLVIRSQELESRLQRLPRRPHVERASTSATIDTLQTHIQWVDYQLSVATDVGMTENQSAQLWENRIQLLDSLLMVRYAEAQRASTQFAGVPHTLTTNGPR